MAEVETKLLGPEHSATTMSAFTRCSTTVQGLQRTSTHLLRTPVRKITREITLTLTFPHLSSTSLFSTKGQPDSAGLSRLLLLQAGDVEENPGPTTTTWLCTTCKRKANTNCVQCSTCRNWVHTKSICSGLQSVSQYTQATFACPSCAHSTRTPPAPTISFITPALPTPVTAPKTSRSKGANVSCNSSNIGPSDIRILQYNCNGIAGKTTEILDILSRRKIDIVVLQETKLSARSKSPVLPGYALIRKDRNGPNPGGGLLTGISHELNYSVIPSPADAHLESLTIRVTDAKGQPLTISNIYIPPASSCAPGYEADISHFLRNSDNSIVLGDFNAHDASWYSSNSDTRGTVIADAIDAHDFAAVNRDCPTRIPSNGRPTSPDITICALELLPQVNWKTITSGSSDHLPIITELVGSKYIRTHRNQTFANFGKADWIRFKRLVEEKLEAYPIPNLPAPQAEPFLRKILQSAAASSIPRGRVHKRVSALSPEILDWMAQRDALREDDPSSPDIASLNIKIRRATDKNKRDTWRQFMEEFDPKRDANKLWKTIKMLNDKGRPPPNCAVEFGNNMVTESNNIANCFNKGFTRPVEYSTDKGNRKIRRHTQELSTQDFEDFTTTEVGTAIRSSKKSRAIGPDGLAPVMLHHLGKRGIAAVTHIINDSFRNCRIPMIWKSSIILPLLKPGKEATNGSGYRPISLLSPIAKIMERLLLEVIRPHMQPAAHQHGFTSGRSTTTALHTLSEDIAEGFNQKKPASRTVLMAIDMSKAFDSLDIHKLTDLVLKTDTPDYAKKWLANYLRGRTARTTFREATSKAGQIRSGVPQGSALSPTLFNLYLKDLPDHQHKVKVISYADDITVWASEPTISAAADHLRAALPAIEDFLKTRKLSISPAKSQLMLLTPFSKEYRTTLNITVGNVLVPTVNTAKILGVTYDTMFTFSQHARGVAARITQRNNVLKALAGSTWGNQKETLRLTYKAISQAVYAYAAPAWSSFVSTSAIDSIQRAQNAALRTITGNHKMADIDHLHSEAKIMQVRSHLDMLSAQFLARSSDPSHACHGILQKPLPPRNMKASTRMAHKNTVMAAIAGASDPSCAKAVAGAVHTIAVAEEKRTLKPPAILGGRPPPDIHKEEADLPRNVRCTLSQLRSGHSRFTNHYLHRVDDSVPDSCPDCGNSPHDVHHLFTCPAHPTTLIPTNLWNQPREVATFLGLL